MTDAERQRRHRAKLDNVTPPRHETPEPKPDNVTAASHETAEGRPDLELRIRIDLEPLIRVLETEAGKSMATYSPNSVGVVASQLRNLVGQWFMDKRTITNRDLNVTGQTRLDAAIRQHRRELEREFDERVRQEVHRRLDAILPTYVERQKRAELIEFNHKGYISRAEFNALRMTAHPDNSASAETRSQALQLLLKFEHVLVKREERRDPNMPELPKTAEELREWGRKAEEARRQKRAAAKAAKEVASRNVTEPQK